MRQELLEEFLEEVLFVRRRCAGSRCLYRLKARAELCHRVGERGDGPVAKVVNEALELHVAIARYRMLWLQERSDLPLEDDAGLLVTLLDDTLE